MRKGRYNVLLPTAYGDNVIRKFNVYQNDYGTCFISFEGEHVPITKKERYKGGWLWQFKNHNQNEVK